MRKISIALLFAITLFIAGCGQEDVKGNKEQTKSEPKEVKVEKLSYGFMPSIESIPLMVAKEKGFFERNNLDVQLIKYKNSQDINNAIMAGNIDIVTTDLIGILNFQEGKFDYKITSGTNVPFYLIGSSKSGVKNISQLEGKKVAGSPNGVTEYIIDHLGKDFKVSYNKTFIPPVPERMKALDKGEVDAAILPEPLATIAVSKGGVRLASSMDVSSGATGLATAQKVIDTKPEAIERFYKAYNEGIEYMNSHEFNDYKEIISIYGFAPEIESSVNNLEWSKAHTVQLGEFDEVIKWLKEKGKPSTNLRLEDISNFQFINAK